MADRAPPPDPTRWLGEKEQDQTLDRVTPSTRAGGTLINTARTHLQTAQGVAGSDPLMSITAAYDAARKAVSGHMAAKGYRVANKPGSHRVVVEYGRVVLAGDIPTGDVDAFDELRRDRRTAEYGLPPAQMMSPARVERARELSTRIVNAVATALASELRR